MRNNKWLLPVIGVIVIAAVLFAVLGGGDGNTDPVEVEVTATTAPAPTATEAPIDSGMSSGIPDWFDYEFTDARTGETFTINDFQGKVVLIQTTAMACPECLDQLNNLKPVYEEYGGEDGDFVAVALNIAQEEDLSMLQAYAEYYEFDWFFTVPPDDIVIQIASTFGPQYIEPNSIPLAIIDKHGNLHNLPVGPKTSDQLFSFVEVYLD